jgi:hypothetical protein
MRLIRSSYALRLSCVALACPVRPMVVSLLYLLARTPSFSHFGIFTALFSVLAFSVLLPVSPFSSAFAAESS